MSEAKETHVHVLEDGTTIEHSHGEHGHHHSHEAEYVIGDIAKKKREHLADYRECAILLFSVCCPDHS